MEIVTVCIIWVSSMEPNTCVEIVHWILRRGVTKKTEKFGICPNMGTRAWTRLPFLHGSHIPSPTAQTLLCAPSKSQPVCPGLGIYEPSESKASGLGSVIKNYSSPWPGLGSHIYTLSGAESWPWINSPLALNHFAPGPGSYINSSSGANTMQDNII